MLVCIKIPGSRQNFQEYFSNMFISNHRNYNTLSQQCCISFPGMPLEVEQVLSPILVEPIDYQGLRYGTKSKTVIAVWSDGSVEYRERTLAAGEGSWEETCHQFALEGR